jgi:hypothetical protein
LFDEIKADLPNILSTSWDLWRQTQMNTAFMFQMAATFGINVSDIEIVS